MALRGFVWIKNNYLIEKWPQSRENVNSEFYFFKTDIHRFDKLFFAVRSFFWLAIYENAYQSISGLVKLISSIWQVVLIKSHWITCIYPGWRLPAHETYIYNINILRCIYIFNIRVILKGFRQTPLIGWLIIKLI